MGTFMVNVPPPSSADVIAAKAGIRYNVLLITHLRAPESLLREWLTH